MKLPTFTAPLVFSLALVSFALDSMLEAKTIIVEIPDCDCDPALEDLELEEPPLEPEPELGPLPGLPADFPFGGFPSPAACSPIDIQGAIDAAEHGDTVVVPPGEHPILAPLDLRGKKITLRSEAGPHATILRRVSAWQDPCGFWNHAGAAYSSRPILKLVSGEGPGTRIEGFTLTGVSSQVARCRYIELTRQVYTCSVLGGEYGSLSDCMWRCRWTICEGGGLLGIPFCFEQVGSCFTQDRVYGVWDCEDAATLPRGAGAVLCANGSSPTIVDCVISGNSADEGGGLTCRDGSSPTLVDCAILDNVAYSRGAGSADFPAFGGGVFCDPLSSPTLRNCRLAGNVAATGGGAVFGPATLIDCTVVENRAGLVAGDIPADIDITERDPAESVGGGVAGGTTLENTIVWENEALGEHANVTPEIVATYSCIDALGTWPGEGNILAEPRFCVWETTEVEVEDQAGFEEALTNRSLDERLYLLRHDSPCVGTGLGSSVIGADEGVCGESGGDERLVRLAAGTYVIEGRDLAHSVSLVGAGADETTLVGTVRGLETGALLADLTVSGGKQGGVWIAAGESTEIRGCEVRGNVASGRGGGIRLDEGASLALSDSRLVGNVVLSTPLGRSFFGAGGGISLARGASASITNTLVAGNSASGGAGGIDFSGTGGATLTLVNCTVADNLGRGLRDASSSASDDELVSIRNSIIWGNERAAWLGAHPVVTHSDVAGTGPVPGDGNINGDPLYERRGDFRFDRVLLAEKASRASSEPFELPNFVLDEGDYSLRAGSPAIDAGRDEQAPEWDLAGYSRPQDLRTDMGAFESFADCNENSVSDATDIGAGNERDCDGNGVPDRCEIEAGALADENGNGLADACEPRFRRGDSNGDGKRNLADPITNLNYQMLGGVEPPCLDACDFNDDGVLNLTDPIANLARLFNAGPAPAGPGDESCVIDASADDELGCDRFAPCELTE